MLRVTIFRCWTECYFAVGLNAISLLDWMLFRCWAECYFAVGLNVISLLDWMLFRCWIECYFAVGLNVISLLDWILFRTFLCSSRERCTSDWSLAKGLYPAASLSFYRTFRPFTHASNYDYSQMAGYWPKRVVNVYIYKYIYIYIYICYLK